MAIQRVLHREIDGTGQPYWLTDGNQSFFNGYQDPIHVLDTVTGRMAYRPLYLWRNWDRGEMALLGALPSEVWG